jgi:hypothetical protein
MSSSVEGKAISSILDGFPCFGYKKGGQVLAASILRRMVLVSGAYIIPPMPPPYPPPGGIGGIGGSSFGFSATIASVVSMRAATDAAF